jgi:hypothetical protein
MKLLITNPLLRDTSELEVTRLKGTAARTASRRRFSIKTDYLHRLTRNFRRAKSRAWE